MDLTMKLFCQPVSKNYCRCIIPVSMFLFCCAFYLTTMQNNQMKAAWKPFLCSESNSICASFKTQSINCRSQNLFTVTQCSHKFWAPPGWIDWKTTQYTCNPQLNVVKMHSGKCRKLIGWNKRKQQVWGECFQQKAENLIREWQTINYI